MNTYQCFYNGKTTEVLAPSLYAAKVFAIKAFAAPKSKQHMISVVLVELANGTAINCATEAL